MANLSRRSFFGAVAASPLSVVTPAKVEPDAPAKVVVHVSAGSFDREILKIEARREAYVALARLERECSGDWRA